MQRTERPKLKISIKHLNTQTIQGFMGTVYDENGEPIKEAINICRTWLIEYLGNYATWYIDNVIMEEQNETTCKNTDEE